MSVESEAIPFELDPDLALFSGHLNGMVATCYTNERPVLGLLGLLDWRFRGAISDYIRAGVMTGEVGECVYLPVSRLGRTYHILVVGGGFVEQPGQRQPLATKALATLRKNLISLSLGKIGVSIQDIGAASDRGVRQLLKSIPIEVVH